MTLLKGLLAATISLAGITAATTADAAVYFTVGNAAFRDGSAVTGSFTTTDDRTAITDFTLITNSGIFLRNANPNGTPIPTDGFTFTAANSSVQILSNGISFKVTGTDQTGRSLFLNYRGITTATTADRTQFSFSERQAADENNSRIGTGFATVSLTPPVVTTAVPEPATWAMMLLGFGGMGATLRRRPRVAARIRFA